MRGRAEIGVPELREELSREELEAAQRGFERILRRKRFSRAFIDRHGGDLLAKARLEYAQHAAKGGEVRNPAGWIIHCAWRRTQNLLEQEERAPHVLSIDDGVGLAIESTTPEQEVLGADRYRQLQAALEQLPHEERKVIALTYFEGMSVREVGRTLKWDKCKADRRHRAGLEHLKDLLGVTDVDALQIEIGIVAWVSLGASARARPRLPASVESAFNGITSVFGRGQEIARRLITSGTAEPGMAPAIGGAVRTASVCGAAAVACLATGVMGPGVGGFDVLASQHHRQGKAEHRTAAESSEAADRSTEVVEPILSGAMSSANATGVHRPAKQAGSKAKPPTRPRTNTATSATSATSQQVAQEFDPFAGDEVSRPSSGASDSSTSNGSSGSSLGSSSPPSQASGQQVDSEFGL
jgi:RNA polymerase sigma factor (sigma-70 family)